MQGDLCAPGVERQPGTEEGDPPDALEEGGYGASGEGARKLLRR